MLANKSYSAGRLYAGAAVGRYTGRTSLGITGSVTGGLLASTQGQIDKFSAQVVMGGTANELVLGAESETIIEGFFGSKGWDTDLIDNEDGTTIMAVSRTRTGSRIKERYKVATYTREQKEREE